MNEDMLHEILAQYIRVAYPKAIFRSDQAGVYKGTAARVRQKRLQSGRGYPDLFIAEPIGTDLKNHACGLFVELKREGTRVYLKDGSYSTDKHIAEQALMLESLRRKNYIAEFAVGYDQAKGLVDWYMGGCNGTLQQQRGDDGSMRFVNGKTGEIF